MRIRPLATAAAAVLVLGAIGGPAVASAATAPAARPAAGTATSALTLLSLALAGHDVRVGTVALTSDTVAGAPTAKVVVTPVRADGKTYGEQTVTPASSPASVPSFDSAATLPAALATVASIQSPVFNISTSTSSGASSKAGTASLGSVKVLGLPVALNGTVDVSSLVNNTNALGQKTLTVKNLALPSIADILGALGLNLSALPVKTLTDLLAGLKITDTAVTTAQAALDTASATIQSTINSTQAQIDAAQVQLDQAKVALATKLSALDGASVNLAAAQQAVTAAQSTFDSATAAQTTAKSALDTQVASISAASLGAEGSALYTAYLTANPSVAASLTAATNTYNSATSLVTSTGTALANAKTASTAAAAAVAAAQAAVDAAQKVVTDLTALLTTLLNTLKTLLGQLGPQLANLLAAVTAVLDKTPLVSIDSFTVQTKALVTSASAGGQSAQVIGGEIQGVNVLGTDVLANVLGNTKINVLDLAGSTLSQVTSKIDALNGVLSSVLSAVPGLSIPAPQVDLLTKSTSTGIANGFGTAKNSVQAMQVTIPAITLPAALALPSAASLPAISGVPNLAGALGIAAIGDLTSQKIVLGLGTLSEQASFRPAVTAAPGTPAAPGPTAAPQLPRTGLPAGVALLALLLVTTGLVVRRRFAAEA